jgi:tetratricopeptide (TPR) repeat protein
MDTWNSLAKENRFAFDPAGLKKQWPRLHAGDREPVPQHPKVWAAWVHFHNGEFFKAYTAGLKIGLDGMAVACKAACIYATYVEPKEKNRQELYLEIAERAAEHSKVQPEVPNNHYWQAYALGRYSQSVSVAKALAQGIGSKVKNALETTIRLEPRHADAHIALGMFHAEVIDKVGLLIGNLTYGAKKDISLKLFQEGLLLTPKSPMALMEYANAMVMLEGDKRTEEATRLYKKAAATQAADATERLEVALALAELAD